MKLKPQSHDNHWLDCVRRVRGLRLQLGAALPVELPLELRQSRASNFPHGAMTRRNRGIRPVRATGKLKLSDLRRHKNG